MSFIEEIISEDIKAKSGPIITRFPPEPNGYLHIGHAASICLNFGLAKKFRGHCNLRFDDTNPSTEKKEYIDAIKQDISWLGFTWQNEFYASDYFEDLYSHAITLIEKGLAYVDDLSSEEIAKSKGTTTTAGINSPFRDRDIETNLNLFKEMRAGIYKDEEKVLRAKINMAHSNLLMRDPILYRIKHESHHRTGNAWCIYPLYDFAHGQSDSIEYISHSICTMEFIAHKELYDWLIAALDIFAPKQIEFAKRNVSHTVTSKRKLKELVDLKIVDGWDDPRMPTIAGLRRRGFPPESIRLFCERAGIGRKESVVDFKMLEACAREVLAPVAVKRMAVLNPIKAKITNFSFDSEVIVDDRRLNLSDEIWIDGSDFQEVPDKDFFRLTKGSSVRLKGAFIIRCDDVVKDSTGLIQYLNCSINEGAKVKSTIQWVDSEICCNIKVIESGPLFNSEEPGKTDDFMKDLNVNSRKEAFGFGELGLTHLHESMDPYEEYIQFIRIGYFIFESSNSECLVFNKTVGLK